MYLHYYQLFVIIYFATTPRLGTERGCVVLETLHSFILSVVASVVASYIFKWLDKKDDSGSQPRE